MSIPASEPGTRSVRDGLPEGALGASARELHQFLPSNSLVRLAGDVEPPLLVSVLQHGNETTGWQAVQRLLQSQRRLPRTLLLYFGNLEAARHGQRHIAGEPDFNRSWPGTQQPESALARAMEATAALIAAIGPLAAIDCHNNTGSNPHYSVLASTDEPTLRLAGAFSATALFFDYPSGVQTMALSRLCPAVTLECGRSDDSHTLELCERYLDSLLHDLSGVLTTQAAPPRLMRMNGSIRVRPGVRFDFGGNAELSFRPDLDALNFTRVPAGTVLGYGESLDALECRNAYGQAIDNRWLGLENNRLVTRTALTPAMLSTDVNVVRQDCLGYVLTELDSPGNATQSSLRDSMR